MYSTMALKVSVLKVPRLNSCNDEGSEGEGEGKGVRTQDTSNRLVGASLLPARW